MNKLFILALCLLGCARSGLDGPQGERGMQGPQGKQGPQGATAILSRSHVVEVMSSAEVEGGSSAIATVSCPSPASVLLAGGCSYDAMTDGYAVGHPEAAGGDHPETAPSFLCTGSNTSTEPRTLTAWANCYEPEGL